MSQPDPDAHRESLADSSPLTLVRSPDVRRAAAERRARSGAPSAAHDDDDNGGEPDEDEGDEDEGEGENRGGGWCRSGRDEDEDDEDEGDEDEGEEPSADAASPRAPRPAKPRTPRAPRPPRRAPTGFEAPAGASHFKLTRTTAAGVRETCSVLRPDGLVLDRYPCADALPANVLALFGSGAYELLWFRGRDLCGKSRALLESAEHPTRPAIFRPPPAPPASAEPPASAAAPVPPRTAADERRAGGGSGSFLADPAALSALRGVGLESFLVLQEVFSRQSQREQERLAQEYELRLGRMQADASRALDAEQQRHRLYLDELESRHRRETEHIARLSEQMQRGTRGAQMLAPVLERLEELEERVDSEPEGGGRIDVKELSEVLLPLVQALLARKSGT